MSHQNITIEQLSEVAAYNFGRIANGHRWQPIVLLGGPGQAKTQWSSITLRAMYAEQLGVKSEDIGVVIENPGRRDAAEIAGVGLPSKDANGNVCMHFTVSPVIKKIEASGCSHGILIWDELTAAKDPEQKVVADSLDPNEHTIGGNPIPDGWIVVATGNRAADKAGATRLLSHLTNRAMVFEIEFAMRGLKRWWIEKGANPILIECAEAHVDNGFFADAVPTTDQAYCTPRSLYEASLIFDAMIASEDFTGQVTPLQERILAANIGPGAASTVTQYVAQRDQVPSAEDILRNPEGALVPDQTGFQMIAANVAMGAVNDARSAEAALHYIVRLRPDLQVSLGSKLMRISARQGWTVTDPLAAAFIEKFHDLIPLAE